MRDNIIIIADEAHRSQYGFLQGYARYLAEALPNARRLGQPCGAGPITDSTNRSGTRMGNLGNSSRRIRSTVLPALLRRLAEDLTARLGRGFSETNLRQMRLFYLDRKSTRLNSSHLGISYAVFCLK